VCTWVFAYGFIKYFFSYKKCNFQVVPHVAQIIFDLGTWNFYRNVPYYVKLCIWCFACGFILFYQSKCSWLSKNFQFSICVVRSSKVFDMGHETWQEFWSACVDVHLGDLPVELFSICRVISLNLVKKIAIFNLCHA
jgi:hypothetical protein